MIGTTPTHIFKLSLDVSMIKEIKVTYKQNDKIVLEKHTEDFDFENNVVKVCLSQEDTFLFDDGVVSIQLRALTFNGKALKSKVYKVLADECLDREVLI